VAQTLIPVYSIGQPVSALVQQAYGATGLGVLYNPTQGPLVGSDVCPAGGANLTCNLVAQNQLQAAIIASSRLHIPVSFVAETLHGAINGGTVFPMSSTLGCSWDVELVQRVASAIAVESRIVGLDRGYSPLLNVGTDPRFGRSEEFFGSDPAHVAAMGVAFATGQHGGETGGPATYLPATGLVTEAKHLGAYAVTGLDAAPSDISDQLLFEVYLRPWRDFVAVAGGRGVMASHNSLQGVPNHANKRLLTDILRNQVSRGGG